MENIHLGFAVCGSFCTHSEALEALAELSKHYGHIQPIVSENTAETDTRFGTAKQLIETMEGLCGGTKVISSIKEAEPIGPQKLLDVLVIAPCTGNTLAKLAHGIADTPVTMAAKSHLRNARPIVLAISTNDGLSTAGENIGALLARKHYYFVPFGQDDAENKPTSLVADMSKVTETVKQALAHRQIQPLLV